MRNRGHFHPVTPLHFASNSESHRRPRDCIPEATSGLSTHGQTREEWDHGLDLDDH